MQPPYTIKFYDITDLIQEVKSSLKYNNHFSALILTFMLISECVNIEYPNKWFEKNAEDDEYLKKHFPKHYTNNGKYICKNHDKERFQMWVDDWENFHNYKKEIGEEEKKYLEHQKSHRKTEHGILPIVNGELLYQLRSSLVHTGSKDIDFNFKITDNGNKHLSNNKFILIIEEDSPYTIYVRSASIDSYNDCSLYINITELIKHYIYLIEKYIEKNKDKKFNIIKTLIPNEKL